MHSYIIFLIAHILALRPLFISADESRSIYLSYPQSWRSIILDGSFVFADQEKHRLYNEKEIVSKAKDSKTRKCSPRVKMRFKSIYITSSTTWPFYHTENKQAIYQIRNCKYIYKYTHTHNKSSRFHWNINLRSIPGMLLDKRSDAIFTS